MRQRLFIALELAEPVRDALLDISTGVPGAHWVEDDQLHLTLRYLGEVDGNVRDDLVGQLDRLQLEPFEISLEGIGFFPPRGPPESLWIGVAKNPALLALQQRVDTLATRLGIARARRRWIPHVTLARLDDAPESRLVRFATEHALFKPPPAPPPMMTLFSSHRRIWGSEYLREAVFPFPRVSDDEESPEPGP